MTKIKNGDTILFLGDSITAYGRVNMPLPYQLCGYPAMIYDKLKNRFDAVTAYNRATGGNTIKDLYNGTKDFLEEIKPTFVSVLIGINDIWRHHDSCRPFSKTQFESDYRELLDLIKQYTDRILLIEPFLVEEKDSEKACFRKELEIEKKIIKRLAEEYNAFYVLTDDAFSKACKNEGVDKYSLDGVHVTEEGFGLIAELWLKNQIVL